MKKISLILAFILLISTFSVSAALKPQYSNYEDVVVVTYHLVSKDPAHLSDFCVTPEILEADIKHFKLLGYEFVTASQLATSKRPRGKKTVVITFDDGYESDFLYVVPLLEKYNACATFFIFGEAIGKEGYLSKEQLLQMSKKTCVEIGNHSYNLHNLNFDDTTALYAQPVNNRMILDDYKKNDEFLKSITGKYPTALSYPYGVHSTEIDTELKKRGKTITFSTIESEFKGLLPNAPVGRKNRSPFISLDSRLHKKADTQKYNMYNNRFKKR